MGFQDRDYNRYEPYDDSGYRRRSGGSMRMITKIIIINVVLWLANGLFTGDNNFLTALLSLHGFTLTHPEYIWQLLTYGFVHSPTDIWHILGNMLGLFFLGYEVENRLGSRELLCFYLATIVFGGLSYALINLNNPHAMCMGASGGVVGVIILFALMFPNRMLYIWGIFPMPAWGVGLLCVGMDLMGVLGHGRGDVAFSVHLAGAAFALLYYYCRWNFGRFFSMLFGGFSKMFQRKPKLHVYREDEKPKREEKSEKDVEFEKRLDEILERYGKVGESGLTSEERKFLQNASKKYRDKNK